MFNKEGADMTDLDIDTRIRIGNLYYRYMLCNGGECMTKLQGRSNSRIIVRRLFRKGFKAIIRTKRYNIYAGILCNQVVNCTVFKDNGSYEFSLHSVTRRFILDT